MIEVKLFVAVNLSSSEMRCLEYIGCAIMYLTMYLDSDYFRKQFLIIISIQKLLIVAKTFKLQ